MVEPFPVVEAKLHSSPQFAYFVLDRASELVHVSSSLEAILEVPKNAKLSDISDVVRLVKALFQPDPEDLLTLEQVLSHGEGKVQLQQFQTNSSKTANFTDGIQVDVARLGTLYRMVTFERRTMPLDAEDPVAAGLLTDHLTGIANRAHLEQLLDRMLAELAAEAIRSATLLFLDLDRFKMVNDTLGHAVGDSLLRKVSERLQSLMREGDTLARLGGDEFAILLRADVQQEATSLLAAQFIELIQRPYLVDGHVVNVGCSIGIATAPEDGSSRDHLLKSADLALYHSKSAGRGVFHYFHQAMEDRAQQRRVLELELRKALTLRQFELHYQPQIDVEDKKVTGLEAVLRWRHPVRGLLMPEAFMSLAEEIGAAVPIGNWVLKTACKEAMRWPDLANIAVNVSTFQFGASQFEASVQQALEGAGLAAERLEIEVTEDILLRDGSAVLSTLDALRALGVRISMDKFGTGLASLSQLVNFPFSKIKIDESLFCTGKPDAKSRAIVRAISALGQSLGISTLAEGIRTPEHLAEVRSEGCDAVQGFYYSSAVPPNELAELFAKLSPAEKSAI